MAPAARSLPPRGRVVSVWSALSEARGRIGRTVANFVDKTAGAAFKRGGTLINIRRQGVLSMTESALSSNWPRRRGPLEEC